MEYINEFLIALLSAIAGGIAAYLFSIPKQRKAQQRIEQVNQEVIDCRLDSGESALRALLRSDIQSIYNHAYRVGYLTSYQRNNISYLHKAYKELKGNSYIDKVFEQLMELPIHESENKKGGENE